MPAFPEQYFLDRIRSFYADVDRSIRLHGCEVLGAQDIFFRLARVATPEVEYSEIKRILAEVDCPAQAPDEPSGHRRWPKAWGSAARRYQDIAEKAEASRHSCTAGQNFLRAALLAHSGQLFCRPQWADKLALQKMRTECYRRAAPHLGIEALSIPFEGHHLPAYLWIPPGVARPPVVIMAPGANSVKEELHRWAKAFHARGLAALTFDGPGQGELSPLQGGLPLRVESYHRVFSAIIDHLEAQASDRLDLSRLALWGQATGGHLVTRAYEHERRPVALVNLDGFPTLDAYPYLPADIMEEQRDVLGFQTFTETWDYLQQHGSALDAARQIAVPYLVIHGSRGGLAGDEAMQALVRLAGDQAELWLYPDGNLGVFNWDFMMTDAMADWLLDRLKGPASSEQS